MALYSIYYLLCQHTITLASSESCYCFLYLDTDDDDDDKKSVYISRFCLAMDFGTFECS